jgi:hypothetical protein
MHEAGEMRLVRHGKGGGPIYQPVQPKGAE